MARLRAVRVLDEQGEVTEIVDIRKPLCVEIEYWNFQEALRPTISMHFINEDGITLFCTNDWSNKEWWNSSRSPGLVRATCRIPGNFFAEGQVFLLVAVCTYNPDVVHLIERDDASFQVVDRSVGGGGGGDGVREFTPSDGRVSCVLCSSGAFATDHEAVQTASEGISQR